MKIQNRTPSYGLPFLLRSVVLLLFCLALAGCGPATGTVSGKVSFRGKTVRSGSVMVIVSNHSKPVYGQISSDGKYTLENVPLGDAKFAILSPNPDESGFGDRMGQLKKIKQRSRQSSTSDTEWFPIPDRYGDISTSGHGLTVNQGQNDYDIKLK